MKFNVMSYKKEDDAIDLRFDTPEQAKNAWLVLDRLILVSNNNFKFGIRSMTKPDRWYDISHRVSFYDFRIEFTSAYSCSLFFSLYIRYDCRGWLTLTLPNIEIVTDRDNDNIDKVIKDVQFNPKKGAVTILWENGDVTVAKKGPGDKWDPEKGLMMAFGQHFFGSKTQFNNWRKKVLKEGGMTEEFKQPDIFYADSTPYEPMHAKKGDQLLDMFDPQTGRMYKVSTEFIKDFSEFCKNVKESLPKKLTSEDDEDDPDGDVDTLVSEALL